MTRSTTHRPAFGIAAFLVAALIALSGAAYAADPDVSITSSVDRSTVTVGDIIHYTLTVAWADGVDLTPPPLGINLGRFEVRDYKPGEPEKLASGRTRVATTYQVAIYESGDFAIPGVPIAMVDRAGTARTIDSEPIDIHVESLAPETGGSIKDIRKPAEIPVDWRPYAIAAALALAVIATACFVWIWLARRRARRMKLRLSGFHVPAGQWALDELDRLRAAGLIEAGRIDEFYVGVSTVVRGYVERRYFLPALKRTSGEIVVETEALGVDATHVGLLRGFLDDADLVKFARVDPGADAASEMLARARDLVDRTRLTADVESDDEPEPAAGGDEAGERPGEAAP